MNYVLVAITLVGILMNGGLFIYVGGRVDHVYHEMSAVKERLAALEVRVERLEVRP